MRERLRAARSWVGTPPRPVVAGAFAVLASSLLVTAMDRRPPVIVVAGAPQRAPVPPGGTFNGSWTVQVNRPCSAVAHRWLQSMVDPAWIVSLPPIEPQFSEVERSEQPLLVRYPVTTFEVPADAPEGDMSYHSVVSFTCWHWGDALFPINVAYPPMIFAVAKIGPS